jgi:hypothetical protein
MSKVLRNTLALALLVTALANAPGLLFTRGDGDGNSQVVKSATTTRSKVEPVDYYVFDYDLPAGNELDADLWMDTVFRDTGQFAAYRHTWTDFENEPAADALNPYRRPPNWEPEGVLLAYAPTFDNGFRTEGFNKALGTTRFTGSFGVLGGIRTKPQEQTTTEEPPPQVPDAPKNEEPPPPYEPETPPYEPETPPPAPVPDEIVQVPEPTSMSLLALGLGMLMFGFGRRAYGRVSSRGDRDRE